MPGSYLGLRQQCNPRVLRALPNGWHFNPNATIFRNLIRRYCCGSKPMVPFGVGAPPILEPILVGTGMFTGGRIWILTHGHIRLSECERRGANLWHGVLGAGAIGAKVNPGMLVSHMPVASLARRWGNGWLGCSFKIEDADHVQLFKLQALCE